MRKSYIIIFALLLYGCASQLPESNKVSKSPWETFEECKDDYEKITLYKTTMKDLKDLGFDPFTTPNIKVLNHLSVLKMFNYDPDHKEDFPKGVLECIEAREECSVYDITINHINTKRTGPFFKDFLNFKRVSVSSGWIFKSLIIVNNDLVVFKLWGGTPKVDEVDVKKNPLGPLQGAGSWGTKIIP